MSTHAVAEQQTKQTAPQAEAHVPGFGLAAIILLAVIVIVVIEIFAQVKLHSPEMWMGFTLMWFWTSDEKLINVNGLIKSAIGAAVGIAIAAMPVFLAPHLGLPVAIGLFIAAICLAIYITIMKRLSWVINPATVLFLTIAGVPSALKGGHVIYFNMLKSVGIVFVILLVLISIVTMLQKRKAAAAH
jgi:hypothetical protein